MPKITRINAPRPTILRPVPKPRLKGGVVNLGALQGTRATLRPRAGGPGPAGPPGTSDGVWVRPESFGSHSTGGDNQAIMQAAIDAVMNQGGGPVLLDPTKDWGWDGDLVIRDGVWLDGFQGYGATHGLKALSNDAVLYVGKWDDAHANHPGGIFRLRVNGNGSGDVDGLVRFQSVFPVAQGLFVAAPAGHGVVMDAVQNGSLRNVISEDAPNGAAMVFTNGAGGMVFENCHLRSSDVSLLSTDDAGGNGYPFGSAHINFIGGILETYTDGTVLAQLDAGVLKFWGTGFSVNDDSVMADDCVLRISNDAEPGISTYVEFNGCNFNGGNNEYDTIRIAGNEVVVFDGETYLQQTARFIVADGGTPIVRSYGSFVEGDNVGAFTGTENGGATFSFASEQTLPLDFRQRGDLPTILATRRAADGDDGLRMFIDQDGTIGWSDGTDFAAKAALSFATDRLSMVGGLQVDSINTGGTVRTPAAAIFANGAVTLDSYASSLYKIILTGTGHVSSMTVTNPRNGAELIVMVAADGAQAMAWAADMKPNDNVGALPTTGPATGKWLTVNFIYDSILANWIERGSRSLAG